METEKTQPDIVIQTEETLAEMREKVAALENVMLMMPGQHIEIIPVHYFADGLYAREITIPKGATLTGKIHRTQHICTISRGEVSVMTDHGIERICAPYTLVSKIGTKRAFYAHEESVWTTYHVNPDNGTDIDKIEERLIAPSYEALDASTPAPLLEET